MKKQKPSQLTTKISATKEIIGKSSSLRGIQNYASPYIYMAAKKTRQSFGMRARICKREEGNWRAGELVNRLCTYALTLCARAAADFIPPYVDPPARALVLQIFARARAPHMHMRREWQCGTIYTCIRRAPKPENGGAALMSAIAKSLFARRSGMDIFYFNRKANRNPCLVYLYIQLPPCEISCRLKRE